MDKPETLSMLQLTATYYPNMRIDDIGLTVEAWHGVLEEYEVGYVLENLMAYVKTNRFPPSVADLINVKEGNRRAIPSHEETRTMMIGWDEGRDRVAKPDVVNEHLAEMRKILGIERG